MLEISAGGVVFQRLETGELRVQMILDRYGKMTLAKGKMEQGETVEQTALREIQEETGVTGEIVAPLSVVRYEYVHNVYGKVDKEVHYFLVQFKHGELHAQVEEIGDVLWLSPEDAWRRQTLSGYENNDDVLRAALQRLGVAVVAEQSIATFIDHTILKADVTGQQIEKLCEEAIQYGFHSVCVNSSWVPLCHQLLRSSQVKIAAVCGFPFGANASRVKAREAEWAVGCGAHEIDMVLHVGHLLTGNYDEVKKDIREVVKAADHALVKVIFETGYLNDEQKRIACELSVAAGAHYVKTSTGFGPGGATVQDIQLMRTAVGPSIGVKASGGVRDLQTALAMIEAGASRIGTSSGVSIMQGIGDTTAGY
jgi:deoxyribose-phosphate aldolase